MILSIFSFNPWRKTSPLLIKCELNKEGILFGGVINLVESMLILIGGLPKLKLLLSLLVLELFLSFILPSMSEFTNIYFKKDFDLIYDRFLFSLSHLVTLRIAFLQITFCQTLKISYSFQPTCFLICLRYYLFPCLSWKMLFPDYLQDHIFSLFLTAFLSFSSTISNYLLYE